MAAVGLGLGLIEGQYEYNNSTTRLHTTRGAGCAATHSILNSNHSIWSIWYDVRAIRTEPFWFSESIR